MREEYGENRKDWFVDSVLYHVYPLGMLGCERTDCGGAVCHRLPEIAELIPHWLRMGVNAVYFGPIFSSSTHGYDTRDYYHIDRRLGDDADFRDLVRAMHGAGIRVIVDAVFNHVGRGFWGFEEAMRDGESSRTWGWFRGLRADGRCRGGIRYDTWEGHGELVKLDLANPAVREHLFGAVRSWVEDFGIDGIRLDAADCLDPDFVVALREFTAALRPDFLMVGEVIHGDYRTWANDRMMHGTTNYEAYKGLWSSHNDGNFHEIAYSLDREFGPNGIYRGLQMYSFADNHDVDRVASRLRSPLSLYSLYSLMYLMPGTPSIYYGSEWGLLGKKGRGYEADWEIRPAIAASSLSDGHVEHSQEGVALEAAIELLGQLRRAQPALCRGGYRQLFVDAQAIAFERVYGGDALYCVVSDRAATEPVAFGVTDGVYEDILNGGAEIRAEGGRITVDAYPHWARVLRRVA